MSLPIGTQTAGSAHRVLLVDTTQYEPTTPLFLDALREGNAPYRFLDEGPFLRPLDRSIVHKIAYRLAGRRPLTAAALNRALIAASAAFRPTVVVVVKGAYVRPRTLERVKETTGALLINYATDDPFNPVHTTRDLLRGIPHYDLYACTKRAIMADVRQAWCPHAEFVPFGYKPSVHFPEAPSGPEEAAQFASDVVFIGGLDADRVPYVDALLSIPGISIALYGGYWQRLARTRPFARGFAVGRSYRLALGGAKICLCLVRRANRDGHVMRTFEIPACGGFMLAERTDDHVQLFREGREAAFFGSPAELADKIRYYLAHDTERQAIARAGMEYVRAHHHTYTDRLREMLEHLGRAKPAPDVSPSAD